MDRNKMMIVALVTLNALVAGCQPKTPAEKVKNTVQDAAHETGQAIDRAGEKAKDAVN